VSPFAAALLAVAVVVAGAVVLIVLVAARHRRSGADFLEAPAEGRAGPPAVAERPPPPPATPAKAPSRVSGLFGALTASRGAIGSRLRALAGRDALDEGAWDEIEEALIRADVGVKATTRITQDLRAGGVTPAGLAAALTDELAAVLSKGDGTLRMKPEGPSVWLVVGVNGAGKTTTIAKLAHREMAGGRKVVLAAADTFRAAAVDQLETWGQRLGAHVVRHAQGADPGAVVFDALQHAKAKEVDLVIVDTAGRLHTKTNLMDELAKIRRIAERESGGVDEVLLVIDATVGQNGIAQARTFQEAVEVTGVILTKLDGTARGGIVVAVQEELGIPVKAVGLGEGPSDLEPFDARAFAEALVES
jgi:fused signal recognition particle receptor